jgi:hypothetical protein
MQRTNVEWVAQVSRLQLVFSTERSEGLRAMTTLSFVINTHNLSVFSLPH